ncbi:MAG: Glu/Leu/Phe/Val dehydrogenase dimerization domain-containing protein [Anaerolineae bacterium]|nr:Glu/Leu/Phe/Val dehydrogenase dimerization domain-containing protein [Anaerolineae bacterium]MDQ7037354.1 Glu/Leu/Phe/Val dehydrogenase dimerization domain-containing protein [Anaerolineae bacterium]
MSVFDHLEFSHHEQIVFCHDSESGLHAIIAIHNTTLGSGAGGLRMWNYDSFDAAVTDALRLSKGMSYKSAVAGLACGGGKAVIIADPHISGEKREKLLRAFGKYVQSLGGRYWVAEDVGISVDDIKIIMEESDYAFGLPDGSGDPSPFTALGVFEGIKAAVKFQLGYDTLEGIKVAVQGLGHVGSYLCGHLHEAGAKLIVTDINQDALNRIASDYGATVVEPDAIYAQDVDVYAPCALGATINDATLLQLKATIIAGAANNQLKTMKHGDILHNKGILYAPDYVINAGGMINASGDIYGIYSREEATQKTLALYHTLMDIFTESHRSNRPTYIVADEIAETKLRGQQSESVAGD